MTGRVGELRKGYIQDHQNGGKADEGYGQDCNPEAFAFNDRMSSTVPPNKTCGRKQNNDATTEA